MHLWWPNSEEEVDSLSERFNLQGDSFHVGYQYFSKDEGIVHADGSFGMEFLEELSEPVLNAPEETFLIDNDKCLTFDLHEHSFELLSPCPSGPFMCRASLGKKISK